jgi:hypothetical protein
LAMNHYPVRLRFRQGSKALRIDPPSTEMVKQMRAR